MEDKNISKADFYVKENLKKILENGNHDENPRPKYKDGTPAHSIFVNQIFEEYDIMNGEFPIPTLRNTAIKTGIKEILWIYQDQTSSLIEARKRGIKWWDEWCIGGDSIGVRYGQTVRKWDLINKLLKGLEENPFGRRHIMNLYQESDLEETEGLYPCAYETLWSVYKTNGETILDMTLIQRSNDMIMAGAINKIQYVALMMMVASHLGYKVGKFCHLVQNLHIYDRHVAAAHEILAKEPIIGLFPRIELNVRKNFYDIRVEDFEIFDIDGITKITSDLEIAI